MAAYGKAPYGQLVNGEWIGAEPERMPLDRLLAWTGQALTAYHRRTVLTHGLSATALSVLGVLAEEDGLSHRDLAAGVGVTPATLTPVIDALERDEAVERERDRNDRRVVRVRITRTGRTRLGSTLDTVMRSLQERIPPPPGDQEKVIRTYLLAVLAAVDPTGTP
jgi:DNA-binding MarR family transcriptional regulator